MNVFKKQYLDVPTSRLEKFLVTSAIIMEWVSQKTILKQNKAYGPD